MEYLAYMYTKGYGTDVDNKTALDLLEQASRKGNTKASTRLAIMYLNGWGVPINVPRAIEYVLLKQTFDHHLQPPRNGSK